MTIDERIARVVESTEDRIPIDGSPAEWLFWRQTLDADIRDLVLSARIEELTERDRRDKAADDEFEARRVKPCPNS